MQVTFRKRLGLRWPCQRTHKEAFAAAGAITLAAESPDAIERGQTPLRRLTGLCSPYRPWLIGGSFCLVIADALGLVLPWVVRGLLDNVLGAGGMGALWQALVALVAIAVAQALFTFGQGSCSPMPVGGGSPICGAGSIATCSASRSAFSMGGGSVNSSRD